MSRNLDEATLDYFRLRPHFTQHLLWTLEVQGDRVTLAKHNVETKPFIRAKRNPCWHFTKRARSRMLRFVAGVDWPSCEYGKFITVTYPDSSLLGKNTDTNIHRYLFHRSMENHLGKRISLLWRIEWKERQSGMFVGKLAPHIHMVCFGKISLDKSDVLCLWQKAIGVTEWVSVDCDDLQDARKCGIYVSKYCAKSPELQSLDKVSYLNKPGRHWGYLRKPLIPLHPRIEFADLSYDLVIKLQAMQREYNPEYLAPVDGGFTMLGQRAERWREVIMRQCVDAGIVPVYN